MKKKTIKRKWLFFYFMLIMLVIMFSSGCSFINNQQKDQVLGALQNKYGEEFEADAIGDRIDTGHAKVQVHPTSNPELKFYAYLDLITQQVTDEYENAKLGYEAKCFVLDMLKNYGVGGRCSVEITSTFYLQVWLSQESLPTSTQMSLIANAVFNHYGQICEETSVRYLIYDKNRWIDVCDKLNKYPDGKGFGTVSNSTLCSVLFSKQKDSNVAIEMREINQSHSHLCSLSDIDKLIESASQYKN